MEFRDLKQQYQVLKSEIDRSVEQVMTACNFINGAPVHELETQLADYVGVKHCITCANGTDALELSLLAMGVGPGDAVFVPSFTFMSTAEVVAYVGATPLFVDIDPNTFNLDPDQLEAAIQKVRREGRLRAKAVIPVDLFGLPADFTRILPIARQYDLLVVEDGAQGFGGRIEEKRACSFGDLATTSFFPAKPLGCYGDGGAIFTNDDSRAALLRSLTVHGKGEQKYDNVRIGRNSRLDTIQAAILLIKLRQFQTFELDAVNHWAAVYTDRLSHAVITPAVAPGFTSSWAQYTILLDGHTRRDGLQGWLKEHGIPSMVYYPKPLHQQKAFAQFKIDRTQLRMAEEASRRVLSLPMHPYLQETQVDEICRTVLEYCKVK